MSSIIPKRIIQTAKNSNLPLLSRAAVVNIKSANPEFDYLFFDDGQVEDFIDTYFPQYRPIVDAFPIRIQRYDFFRYLAVFHYGGFYFDMDVFLASGLSELLPFGCVFPFEMMTINRFMRDEHAMDWDIGNYAFGAAPGHPFLHAVIENCIRAQKDDSWVNELMRGIPGVFRDEFYVLFTTGPGLISRTLAEYTDSDWPVEVLFPDDVFDISKWYCFGQYGIHLMEATWRKKTSLLHRRLFAAWWRWEERKLFKDSRKQGCTRSVSSIRKPNGHIRPR